MERFEGIELLRHLCLVPGPTGSEERVAEAIKIQLEGVKNIDIKTDRGGNLIVCYPCGKDNAPRVMVSAHMDEVGMMINDITDDGYIKFACLGGIDPRVLCGRHVTLMGENGDIPGVIASKAIHHQTYDERHTATTVDKMYINIGAANKEEALKHVAIGDSGTFLSDFYTLGSEGKTLCSKALDDRLGCAVMIETLRHLDEQGAQLPYDVYFCFTTREEIGLSGAQTAAQAIAPDVSIVLETTAVADIAGVGETSKVAKLGEGGAISLADRSTIYNRALVDYAVELSKSQGFKAQIKKYISGGNDAGHIHKSGKGVRALAISAPTRYLHSATCVAHADDYEAIKQLVRALLCGGKLA